MKINTKIWLSDFENLLTKNDTMMTSDNTKILKMLFDYSISSFVKTQIPLISTLLYKRFNYNQRNKCKLLSFIL